MGLPSTRASSRTSGRSRLASLKTSASLFVKASTSGCDRRRKQLTRRKMRRSSSRGLHGLELEITRALQALRRHCVAEPDALVSHRSHFGFDLFRRQRRVGLEKHPVDVFFILAPLLHLRHPVLDEPEIEVNRHRAFGIIFPAVLRE